MTLKTRNNIHDKKTSQKAIDNQSKKQDENSKTIDHSTPPPRQITEYFLLI